MLPAYAPWRRLVEGDAGVLVVVGPNAGGIVAEAMLREADERPEVWVVSELPLASAPMPAACRAHIVETGVLVVLEEHVEQGGVGGMLAAALMHDGVAPREFRRVCARGYPSKRYGSQAFHRAESGLDAATVLASFNRPWKRLGSAH